MGKGKLAKFEENTSFANLIQPSYEQAVAGFPLKGHWANKLFKNDKGLTLELGCGKGEYTVGLAKRYPHRNFIGIDIKGARMWRGCKTSNDEHIPNVAFLRTRIQNLNLFFAPNEIEEIWITFPDPQPKKERKRLTSPSFLERYKPLLKPDAILHLKTDDTDLYEYTVEMLKEEGHPIVFHCDDLYDPSLGDLEVKGIQTYYEAIWLEMGKKIKYIQFRI